MSPTKGKPTIAWPAAADTGGSGIASYTVYRNGVSVGTTITTSLTSADGTAVVTVADDGPGIPPELLPEVFERFARGDTSRSRAAGSTGLGLAIVFAVVEGHHGETAVESRPGHTAFTVILPLHAEEVEPNGSPQPAHSSIT